MQHTNWDLVRWLSPYGIRRNEDLYGSRREVWILGMCRSRSGRGEGDGRWTLVSRRRRDDSIRLRVSCSLRMVRGTRLRRRGWRRRIRDCPLDRETGVVDGEFRRWRVGLRERYIGNADWNVHYWCKIWRSVCDVFPHPSVIALHNVTGCMLLLARRSFGRSTSVKALRSLIF